jgi:hypothetical protein
LLLVMGACAGEVMDGRSPGDDDGDSVGDDDTGGNGAEPQPARNPRDVWEFTEPCEPVLPRRVTRLSDRHLGNAIKDLLALGEAPKLDTTSGAAEAFLANKASSVNGAVSLKLRDTTEDLSGKATTAGRPAIGCTGDERACARTFIDSFAARAFRRPIATDERDRLMMVYESGRTNYGAHAGGIRLVMEAVLQAPSFLYQTELGTDAGGGRHRLTGFELAAKISFFLTDTLPDQGLWNAAREGRLDTDEGVAAEVDRLLSTQPVKDHIARTFMRLFQVDRIFGISKAPSIKEFTPALAQSMYSETAKFMNETLWNGEGTLPALLTSRKTVVDAAVAGIYKLQHPGGQAWVPVTLPGDQRAGILTQPSVLTVEATPEDSSVVHRGVFVVREMLCFHPPPPAATDLVAGDEINKSEPTERARSEKRMSIARCSGCHGFFDPLGVNFEHYDTLGRYRTEIATPEGAVPVDAAWEANMYDVKGNINDAVDLSQKLAASRAAHECMSRQFASYAIGQRLTEGQACAVGDVTKGFFESGGDFAQLMRDVALWPGLRHRKGDAQ